MPGGSGRHFFCDEHVPRTCRYCSDCTVEQDGEPDEGARVMWRGKDGFLYQVRPQGCDTYCYVDEKGRPDPCAEYLYDEDGFEMVTNPRWTITSEDISDALNYSCLVKSNPEIAGVANMIIRYHRDDSVIDYATFLERLRQVCLSNCITPRRFREYDTYLSTVKERLHKLRKKNTEL